MNYLKKLNKYFDNELETKNEFQKLLFVLMPAIVFFIAGIYVMGLLVWFVRGL